MTDKEYKIKFTNNFVRIEKEEKFIREELRPYMWKYRKLFYKYDGKTVKLSELPEFIKEVGEVILNEEGICEVYNDFREGGCK